MKKQELTELIFNKKSVLCVGLDSEFEKLPLHIKNDYDKEDAIFEFNKAIIDATIEFAVAFKTNLAFYEAMGVHGLIALNKTVAYIRSLNKPIFIIADAKRADIGNTSRLYATAFFGDGKQRPILMQLLWLPIWERIHSTFSCV